MKAVLAACLVAVLATGALAVNRSTTERYRFVADNPCPADNKPVYTHCAGYNIDHVVPICAGGPDTADNMQWLKVEMKSSKDQIERAFCKCVAKHGAIACPLIRWAPGPKPPKGS